MLAIPAGVPGRLAGRAVTAAAVIPAQDALEKEIAKQVASGAQAWPINPNSLARYFSLTNLTEPPSARPWHLRQIFPDGGFLAVRMASSARDLS
jgi:hypothetical protein